MKKLLFVVCALFGFIACTQNPIEEQSSISINAPETIKVGLENDETRIQLNSAQKTVWTKNDLVSVFYKSDANQMWEYRGETGERVADLYRVDAGTASSKMNYVVLVYPYSTDYVLSTASGNIETTLPATQHYTAGSYGIGENLMVSRSEFTQFSLKSVCGWLKLQLTGNGEVVKSIKFRGNDGEQVAGLIYVDTETAEATLASEMGGSDDNNAGGNLIFDDTVVTEVTLDCGEGVTLGAEVTSFYIALPPQTFENGFTVVVECEDYEPMILETSNPLVIVRNTIQPMTSVAHNSNYVIANNEIHYYASRKISNNWGVGSGEHYFGVNIVSHEWNSETQKGRIIFDGDVTKINYAFKDCWGLKRIILPNSVKFIGSEAFMCCYDLNNVTLPDSVTYIGWNAFYECRLESINIPRNVTEIGYRAFYHCFWSQSVVYCQAIIPPVLEESAFVNSPGVIYVYEETIDAYKSAWGTFSYNFVANGNLPADVETTTLHYTTSDGEIISMRYLPIKSNNYNDELGEMVVYGTLQIIPSGEFYSSSRLTSITFPDSVTEIGESACSNCSNLTSVTIPENIKYIGAKAFNSCASLSSIYCQSVTPPTLLGDDDGRRKTFDNNAEGRKIYVPRESVDAYKSASYWSTYANDIVSSSGYYTVVLNNTWRQSTSVSNPDSSLYDGVYESYSNYNVDSGVATMYIDIEGYSEFSIYVRSNAESTYDYVTVSELDSTTAKTTTSGNQSSGTAISNYTKVTYTGIDGGSHRITVTYRKDGSVNNGTDRGYLIIPKNQ